MAKTKRKFKLSVVSLFHYWRLVYRSVLFILATVWYIVNKVRGNNISLKDISNSNAKYVLIVIWVIFMFDMIVRLFPSKIESPGCQKQYKKNYIPTGRTDVKLHDNNATLIVALIWLLPNIVFGALYMSHIFDGMIMLLISLAYSVCDMICILFFCPFQTWFLKNRCCSSCRIYNWDYAMMFTPLFFIMSWYTWSLLAVAIVIVARWEILVWQYPERFSENTNKYIECANCKEKLCQHKKQLIGLAKVFNEHREKAIQRILTGRKK